MNRVFAHLSSIRASIRGFFRVVISIAVSAIVLIDGAATAETRTPLDIVAVLDLSGSMRSSDGAGRFESLFNWLGAAVKSGDRVAVVAMGTGAQEISALEPVAEPFTVPETLPKKRAKYTNLSAGLEHAYYLLNTAKVEGRSSVIVLFSDAIIDMPGGEWASRDAYRYILDSLIPSLKASGIRTVAVVPGGLEANFQLLQEIAARTGGAYFRGVPASTAALMPAPPIDKSDVASAAASSPSRVESPAKEGPEVSDEAGAKQGDVAGPAVVERVIHEGPSTWMVVLFGLFGAVLLGVVAAMYFLFRAGRPDADSEDALEKMLDDVHALKQLTEKRRSSEAELADDAPRETAVPDADSGRLSVSLVAPFLDFETGAPRGTGRQTDDIAEAPAFSTAIEEADPNLSLSTMETMLGLPALEAEKSDE